MKFIHLTDPHLVARDALLHGLDPAARLRACVHSISERAGDAAFCVVTGDIADAGQPEAYSQVREILAELPMPVHLIPGNHDHRERLLAAFSDLPVDDDGFIQSTFRDGEHLFMLLDTLEPVQRGGGDYCARRLAWLEARLAEAGESPVYLFMHHPPFAVGLPGLDEIGLANPASFAHAITNAIGRGANIRHLFFGHVHRPICGQWHGISFSTLYGTNHQTRFDLAANDRLSYTDEPPAYCVVLLETDRVVIHTHQYIVDDSEIGGHPTLAAQAALHA